MPLRTPRSSRIAALVTRRWRMASPRAVYALALLAVAGLTAFWALRGDEPLRAQPVAQAASGSVAVWNSRSGEAILRAEQLAPGDSTSGVVSVGNAGTVAGFFALQQAALDDRPGPGGGRLSDRLELVVADVTGPGAPITVYSGKLGDMTVKPLGRIEPGQVRTYRFTASFPEGQTLPGAGGDNALAGSSTAVRYRWLAVGYGGSRPSADRRAPRLRMKLPPGRRWLAGRRLVLQASCNEACALSARVRLRVGRTTLEAPLRRVLRPGRRTRVATRLSPRWRNAARLARRDKRRAQLRVVASAHDAAGNSTRLSRSMKLVPARDGGSRQRRARR